MRSKLSLTAWIFLGLAAAVAVSAIALLGLMFFTHSSRRDNPSLDLADYHPKKGKRQMPALTALAKDGGYVCAEYSWQSDCLLGRIRTGSKIDLMRGTWGSSESSGRTAILKTLRLGMVKRVSPAESAAFLVGRPQQGTIMRWRSIGNRIENLVQGRRTAPSLRDLTTPQQEILCSEFLRGNRRFGLPKLANPLMPVGRTMRGIDICGLTDSGANLFAQVTYANIDTCQWKLDTMLEYRNGKRNVLVFFCDCPEPRDEDGVKVFPMSMVYRAFVAGPSGKDWLKRATNPLLP